MTKSKRTILAGAIVCLTFLGSLSAFAGPHDSNVDQRLMGQEQRIQEAWQAGRLSPNDYQHLENRLQRIRDTEGQMRSHGGHLTPGQKTQLNDMLNHSEREIERTIHRHGRRW